MTDGPKPALVRALGSTYHTSSVEEVAQETPPDVVIEATGVGTLVFDAIAHTGSYGIVSLTGVSTASRTLGIDAGQLNREIVLENNALVGSVNANLRHYPLAAEALARADVKTGCTS